MGWSQLRQLVDQEAARNASRKRHQFNVRYGQSVRVVRQASGIRPGGIPGLTEQQLRQIEKGKCILMSNAIEALAKAHGMTPNEYLQRLADSHGTNFESLGPLTEITIPGGVAKSNLQYGKAARNPMDKTRGSQLKKRKSKSLRSRIKTPARIPPVPVEA